MSSLERLPSDETDDGNVRLTAQEPESTKAYNPGTNSHDLKLNSNKKNTKK